MKKKMLLAIIGLLTGIGIGIFLTNLQPSILPQPKEQTKQIIGFLPYWLLDKATPLDESYITTLTYFGLNIGGNGHIVKLSNSQEEDPGWSALHSGKVTLFMNAAKKNKATLSLLLSTGDSNAINQLMNQPVTHAHTLLADITPILKDYHFTDVNLDIEDSAPTSGEAQAHFTQFVQTLKQQIDQQHLGTLTIEISAIDMIKPNLINIAAIAPYTNTIIIMAYDYHSPISLVTGPVAPLNGAGTSSEYDVATAVEKATKDADSEKLILGIPLYGYEWETLSTAIRSPIIPGSGVLASDSRMESFLASCATCSAFFDTEAQEQFVVYKDLDTNTYHQISFPNQQSIVAKIAFAKKTALGGVALWALGYSQPSTLTPLANYK